MTIYRSYITKSLEAYIEFDDKELSENGNGMDADSYAFDMTKNFTERDWIISDVTIDTEEFEGELDELQ